MDGSGTTYRMKMMAFIFHLTIFPDVVSYEEEKKKGAESEKYNLTRNSIMFLLLSSPYCFFFIIIIIVIVIFIFDPLAPFLSLSVCLSNSHLRKRT